MKWVFILELNYDGSITKYKARLFAKEHFEQQRVEFVEVYTDIDRFDTMRLLLAIATHNGCNIS